MSLQSFRERVNVWLHDSKERVLGAFQWLTLLVNLLRSPCWRFTMATTTTLRRPRLFDGQVQLCFLCAPLRRACAYHFIPNVFRETWAEGLVMLVLLVEGTGDAVWRPHWVEAWPP